MSAEHSQEWLLSPGGHPTADALYAFRFRDTSDAYCQRFPQLNLSEGETLAVERHLTVCQACQERHAELMEVSPAGELAETAGLVTRVFFCELFT